MAERRHRVRTRRRLLAALLAAACLPVLAPPVRAEGAAGPRPEAALPLQFPVRTPSMRPGPLPPGTQARLQSPPDAPLFLLGSDAYSRAWLLRHRTGLARLGAIGIVVEVEHLAAYRTLQQLAGGVPLAPASFEALVAPTGLRHYPVLVDSDGRLLQELPR